MASALPRDRDTGADAGPADVRPATDPGLHAGATSSACRFFQQSINADHMAVYDVYGNRDQGEALKILAEQYPKGLIRVGIQPDEKIGPPFVAAVQDTWSGFCHGKTNADWLDRGFGAETL